MINMQTNFCAPPEKLTRREFASQFHRMLYVNGWRRASVFIHFASSLPNVFRPPAPSNARQRRGENAAAACFPLMFYLFCFNVMRLRIFCSVFITRSDSSRRRNIRQKNVFRYGMWCSQLDDFRSVLCTLKIFLSYFISIFFHQPTKSVS